MRGAGTVTAAVPVVEARSVLSVAADRPLFALTAASVLERQAHFQDIYLRSIVMT